jgi:flavin-dependent dehydrogenase
VERAEVVVAGGGPAGSSCAARLTAAGVDVLVLDRASFPRDKPCAGWITPEAVACLGLDLEAYAGDHTLQPVRRFLVGRIFGERHEVAYDGVVSYGIRRCELDAYLLGRSRARVRTGEAVTTLRREDGEWIVNESVRAPFLVGAAGHFCPVAREVRDSRRRPGAVIAQEMEIRLTPEQAALCRVQRDRPEIDFTAELDGYGWCFRKGDFLNVGLGRRDAQALVRDVQAYLGWLVQIGRIPAGLPTPLHGHAYRLREGRPPRVTGEGLLLAGDAASLAHAASGEGILPAIQSGQVAADVLVEALRGAGESALRSYPSRLARVVGPWSSAPPVAGPLRALLGRAAIGSPWLTRHVVLDRLFLHRARGAKAPATA